MAFDPEDVLVANGGDLDPAWFNGMTEAQVVANLHAWNEAVHPAADELEESLAEAARKAWVYASGYQRVASDLSARMGTVSVPNEVTKQTVPQGAQHFQRLADRWLAEFYGLVPAARPMQARKRGSVSLSATFRP